jgi:hypothetical protein
VLQQRRIRQRGAQQPHACGAQQLTGAQQAGAQQPQPPRQKALASSPTNDRPTIATHNAANPSTLRLISISPLLRFAKRNTHTRRTV